MGNLRLEDIARQAGVSRSTVSRVINEHPNVREDVRKRVLDVIQVTGYHPNVAARTLASQRTWMIGLVLPRSVSSFFADPYYPRLTQGIAHACNQYNYTLALFLLGSKEDEEKVFPRLMRKSMVDGVLFQSAHDGDHLVDRLVESGMPVVMAGRPLTTNAVSYIDVDNVNAAYNATSHLIRLGRKRIAHIAGPTNSAVGIDRQRGYLQALTERDWPVDPRLMADGDFTEAGGYYAMQKLLPAKPDAVFAASDLMALGAMRAVGEAGLRIPEDVAMVGFDDLPIAVQPKPQLTTVRQPVYQFGYNAVELLIDRIETDNPSPRRVIMDTELIVRESCGALRSSPQ
ncbi:MAG TPA: LacI family DNA-binding transcriptional regulator [Anaerolineaceae bacterium]|nr:LacI family DNA-binding transcriptional regulator [Anaerolineaceae bacterium]